MKKNRRTHKNNLKSAFYIKTIGLTVIFVLLGILYVWQNVQAVKIGYHIKKKERSVQDLQKQLRSLEVIVSRLKMPREIKKNLLENNINLTVPQSWQIVRITEKPSYYEDFFTISSHDIAFTDSQIGKTIIAVPEKTKS